MLDQIGGATEAGSGFGVVMVAAIKIVEAVVYGAGRGLRDAAGDRLAAHPGGDHVGVGRTDRGSVGMRLRRSLDLGDRGHTLRAASDAALTASARAQLDLRVGVGEREDGRRCSAQGRRGRAQCRRDLRREVARVRGAGGGGSGPGDGGAGCCGGYRRRCGGGRRRRTAPACSTVSKESLGKIDPQLDPRGAASRPASTTRSPAVQDAHNATMLGKIEAFEQTEARDAAHESPTCMQQIEFNKNATLGDAMGDAGRHGDPAGRRARQGRQGARDRADRLVDRPGDHEGDGRGAVAGEHRRRGERRRDGRRAARQHQANEHRRRRQHHGGPRRRRIGCSLAGTLRQRAGRRVSRSSSRPPCRSSSTARSLPRRKPSTGWPKSSARPCRP